MSQLSRRTFLGSTAALSLAGAGALALPRRSRAQSANEAINVGLIGVGWRGGQLLDEILRVGGVNIVALCDPDSSRTAEAAKKLPDAKIYTDMRELLEDDDIDAVVIATCNHWHCLAAYWALQAGKDIYVEKPLSHTLWEGRRLLEEAGKTDRIIQVGTQQRSDPLQTALKKYLHEDKALGPIKSVVVARFGTGNRQSIGKGNAPMSPPATLDYNLWLGPAQDEPIFRTNEFHYSWHWVWNTGNGECGNWGVHLLDDLVNVVFQDKHKLPDSACAAGGRVVWNDAGQTPNLQLAYLEAGEIPVLFALSNLPATPGSTAALKYDGIETGYVIHCDGGSYRGGRGGGASFDNEGKEIKKFPGDSGAGHLKNFFDAVRSRDVKSLNCPLALGHSGAGWAHIINSATRAAATPGLVPPDERIAKTFGHDELHQVIGDHLKSHGLDGSNQLHTSPLMKIDGDAEKFIGEGSDAANMFLDRPNYRSEFTMPV
jgi:hypothetical protein